MCLAKRLGTRISGPLFFGFSDPVTQRAIASLYTEEEFTASNEGTSVPSAAPSQLELAVQVRVLKCDLQNNHFIFVFFKFCYSSLNIITHSVQESAASDP